MNYNDFVRQLGTDPGSQDPAFLRARESSPEFIQAAAASDLFEDRLSHAFGVNAPQDLLPGLKEIARESMPWISRWPRYALAASLLLAIMVAGITWRHMNPHFDSVEQYVAAHYEHDGPELVARGQGQLANNVDQVLARFQVALTPKAKQMVGLIKFCPTPAGTGAHMVFNTEHGPITIIFMPDTRVTDGEMMAFDGMQAELVALASGSAAVIGTKSQQIASFYSLVQTSFVPLHTEV